MNKVHAPNRRFAFGLLLVLTGTSATAQEPQKPIFVVPSVHARVSYDTSVYTITYRIEEPSSNTVPLWSIDLDIEGSGLERNRGYHPRELLSPNSTWLMAIGPIRGKASPFASWSTGDDMPDHPGPGVISDGLALQWYNPPSVRRMTIEPWIDAYMDAVFQYREAQGLDFGDDEQKQIQASYVRKLLTLGPLGVRRTSISHWDTFLSDIGQAGQLGWITEPGLLATIQANVASGRQAAVAGDQVAANAKLQVVIDAIQTSTPSQRTDEGYALVLYNAQALQLELPYVCEPKLTAAPTSATRTIGETHTVTATLVNLFDGQPIPETPITFNVTDGPQAGLESQVVTDPSGRALFSYIGLKVGEDTIAARTPLGTVANKGGGKKTDSVRGPRPKQSHCWATDASASPVKVRWEGGPDLLVSLFVPPVLVSAPGRPFVMTERTLNQGRLAAGPSVTRYWISTTSPVDPSTATVLGERSVPALAPGEDSVVRNVSFTVPGTLPAGTYFLGACADADNLIVETDETNNCSYSNLVANIGIIGLMPALDCSQAIATPSLLWPPNHKLAPIAVTGVIDARGNPVTITVTGITQDEPTNGVGDGDTCPDALGVGTSQPQVRAERSGTGNGRVYAISFRADNGRGGSCTGMVTVGVPHDKKDTPVDDGQKFDSTKCP